VDLDEMVGTFKQDMMVMNSTKRSLKNQTNVARKRDPGLEWIIDFNNDGIVTREEIDSADSVFAGEPNLLQDKKDEL
jgi:hypothetical protein